MIQVIDNWHPRPDALRKFALEQNYETVVSEGVEFPGIAKFEALKGDWALLHEKATGKYQIPAGPRTSSFRLYMKGQKQNTFIHWDQGMGRYSGILYLNPVSQGGTAFWTPRKDGADPSSALDWDMNCWVEAKWNRLLLFDSSLWHSRWPLEVSEGTTPETGRLIQLFFFS